MILIRGMWGSLLGGICTGELKGVEASEHRRVKPS